MKISRLIFISFIFILLLFALVTYINSRQTEKVQENSEALSRSYSIVRESTRFQRNVLNMLSGIRGYLLTGESYFVETYDSAAAENDYILDELTRIVVRPSEIASVSKLKILHKEWVNEFRVSLDKVKAAANASSDSSLAIFNRLYRERALTAEQNSLFAELNKEIRNIINEEYYNREVMRKSITGSASRIRNLSLMITLFSTFAGIGVAIFLAHNISSRIKRMVEMSRVIASGNYNVRTPVKGHDELSDLGDSLNHMSQVLSDNFNLLRRKNEELDQYAHIVSHDLKTPLRGIGNVVEWIEEDHGHELPPKVNEYLSLIRGRQERAESLIQGLLSYARIGKEQWPKEEVRVEEMVHDIFSSSLFHHKVMLKLKSDLPTLYTERIPLFQVLSNLIVNAVKYNNSNNGAVAVYHKDHGSHFEFFVEDNGPGIEKAYQAKIFRIFQTLEIKDSYENTGVGLAIVKKVLDDRKETIHLESEPGSGSIFSFTWSK